MAAMHPAVIWLIIAAILGTALLIATFIANRNQKKKKKGKYFIILWSRPTFGDNISREGKMPLLNLIISKATTGNGIVK